MMCRALCGSVDEEGARTLTSPPIIEAMMEIDDYENLIAGITCLAENNGFIYTVTSTGYRYTLNIKMIAVEAGLLVKYKVELYHLSPSLDLASVREIVLSGKACREDSCFPVEIDIEKSGSYGKVFAFPPTLSRNGELSELIKVLRVDGSRCRERSL